MNSGEVLAIIRRNLPAMLDDLRDHIEADARRIAELEAENDDLRKRLARKRARVKTCGDLCPEWQALNALHEETVNEYEQRIALLLRKETEK